MLDKDTRKVYALWASFLESDLEARWCWIVTFLKLFFASLFPAVRSRLITDFNNKLKD